MRKLVNTIISDAPTAVTTHLADDGGVWITTEGRAVHVDAVPQHTPEDIARAKTLGYANVDAMTREHDYLHSLLAHAQFYHSSLALRMINRPGMTPEQRLGVEREEGLVLYVQRLLNVVRSQPAMLLDELELPDVTHDDVTA